MQAGLPHRDTALINTQLCGRDVDHHPFGLQVLGQPTETFEVDAQLVAAHRRADVELGHGAGTDHTVCLQRVAELEGLDRLDQFVTVLRAVAGRRFGQVPAVVKTPREFGYARVVHAGAQQRAGGDRVPMRQRLQAHGGIGTAQTAVEVGAGARLVKRQGQVVQAGRGKGQHCGVGVLQRWLGMPQRLEARLLQTPVVQVLQGLQVLLAGADIAA